MPYIAKHTPTQYLCHTGWKGALTTVKLVPLSTEHKPIKFNIINAHFALRIKISMKGKVQSKCRSHFFFVFGNQKLKEIKNEECCHRKSGRSLVVLCYQVE